MKRTAEVPLEAINDVSRKKCEHQFTNASDANMIGGINKCHTQDRQKSGSVPIIPFLI